MRKTLEEIAQIVGGEISGDKNTVITGVAGIKEAREGDITFLANPKYLPLLAHTQASAIVVSPDITACPKPVIRCENPSLAFSKVVSILAPADIPHPRGIHQTAIIGKDVELGKNVSLGAYAVIGERVCIGDNTTIYPHCYIGNEAKIGHDSVLYANVSVRERVLIGSRAIIHSGTVIGSDGFGFLTIDGKHQKIPQSGTVEIGDDVEIGANVTIDRARFDRTVIARGTKIDNLVQIAHNVVIGEDSLILAQVGISGSTVIGKNVTLAGQVGVVGHIAIGDGAIATAQSGVSKSIPENTIVLGAPAKPIEQAKKLNACVSNLPRLYELVKELKGKIEELEKKLGKS